MPRILMVAPLTLQHGQGRVSCEVLELLHASEAVVTTLSYEKQGRSRAVKMVTEALVLLKLLNHLLFRRYDLIYWTPSRRFGSSLKDGMILLLGGSRRGKTRSLAHLHGSDLDEFLAQSGIYGRWLRRLYEAHLDCMIILSPSHRTYALGAAFPRYKVVENFSDVAPGRRRGTPASVLPAECEALSCFHLSNPDPTKGGREAVAFAERLAKASGKRVNLTLIGWTEASFKAVYGRLPAPPRDAMLTIRFLGRLDGEEKVSAMLKGGTCLFFSRYPSEAQPLAVIEALDLGLPVITHDFKMLRDFASAGALVRELDQPGGEYADYLKAQELQEAQGVEKGVERPFSPARFRSQMAELLGVIRGS